MSTEENRTRIDAWVAAAPDRVIEIEQQGERWTAQAIEGGLVRYQEVDFGFKEPALNLLANWCELQL